MLLSSIFSKLCALLFAFSLAQVSLWTNTYVTYRLNATFYPLVTWVQSLGSESSWDTALIKPDFSFFSNESESNGLESRSNGSLSDWTGPYDAISGGRGTCLWTFESGWNCNAESDKVTDGVAPSGIQYEPVIIATSGTWEDSEIESEAPGVLFVIGTMTLDAFSALFNPIKRTLKPLFHQILFYNCKLRAYLPWKSNNPAVELAVIWTAYAVFLLLMHLYEKRQEKKMKAWKEYTSKLGIQCRAELDAKFHEILSQSGRRRDNKVE